MKQFKAFLQKPLYVIALVCLVAAAFFSLKFFYKPTPYPERPQQLMLEDLETGRGAEAAIGKKVAVRYAGWFYDPSQPFARGKQFDSSLERGSPYEFILGRGQVIPGWDQGLVAMREGGKRRLIIPARLGYADTGAGQIVPPDADLVFEIDLISVK